MDIERDVPEVVPSQKPHVATMAGLIFNKRALRSLYAMWGIDIDEVIHWREKTIDVEPIRKMPPETEEEE